MTITLPFDDLEGLSNAISDEFGPFGRRIEITQQMVNDFAELTNDHQWIHVDVERATRESPFGGPIAHGFLTLSLIPAISDAIPVRTTGHSAGVNFGAESLRFLSPVRVGAEIHARGRLVAVEPRSGGTLLTTEWDVRAVDAEKPAVLYRMQVLYR